MSKAVEFATKKHDGQTRSAGVPYITHPIRVMETVSKYTSNENIIIAAVLHDTLEDTATTFDEIATTFSTDAANLVKEVTSDDTKLQQLADQEYDAHVNKRDHATHALAKQMSEKIPDIDGKTLKKRLGKSLYLSQKTMGMSTGALLIKLADRFVVKNT
jgi:(p)ppGpp synthase/HD superfamily hydrolase